jgi:hypothetical protein
MMKLVKHAIKAAAVLAVVLAGAGCVKLSIDFSDVDIPVSFSTYGMRPLGTKADSTYVAPGADFATGAVIGVYGFYHDDSTWAADSTAGTNIPDFMYNQAVTKQSGGGWTYSPLKYWPNEHGANAVSDAIDRLSFWAYYPYNASGLTFYRAGSTTAYDNDTDGLPKISFTQNENPDRMTDLMFAVPQKDLYKNDAGGHGAVTDGEVQFIFRHALALVEFQLGEGTGAEVDSLSLTNIRKSGIIENPNTVPFVWTGVSGLFNISRTNLTVTGTTLLSILAVPQSLDPDATFTLRYNIEFASSDPSHPEPIVYTGESAGAKLFKTGADAYGVTAWEAGKHYIYKVSAGLDRIEFEEIVESDDDWGVGNSNIAVPEQE